MQSLHRVVGEVGVTVVAVVARHGRSRRCRKACASLNGPRNSRSLKVVLLPVLGLALSYLHLLQALLLSLALGACPTGKVRVSMPQHERSSFGLWLDFLQLQS